MSTDPSSSPSGDKACVACGEVHPPGPVGVPGGAFAGIEFQVCPHLPGNGLYIDGEFPTGPPGALLIFKSE